MPHKIGLLVMLLACAATPGRALAAPLSEKEIDAAAKECEKLAARGKTDEALERVAALAAEGTGRAVRTLIELAVRVEGGQVYRGIVAALAKVGTPDGLAEIIAIGKSGPTREMRLVVADAVLEDPSAKEELVPIFLREKEEAIVRLMIELVRLRVMKAGVEPLIEIIERDESGEWKKPLLALEARRVLRELTEREFETARDWRNWWEPRKEKWDPYEGVPGEEAPARQTAAREEPRFFGTEVESSRVAIVVDISGSMAQVTWAGGEFNPECKGHTVQKKDGCPACHFAPAGGDKPEEWPPHNHPVPPCICKKGSEKRIDRARGELIALIESLADTTFFNLIAFNSNVSKWQKACVRASKEAKASAVAWVKKLKEEGFTETGKALEAAFEDPAVDAIYLISDGAPERSAKEKIPTEPILRAIEKKNRFRKVKIFTLGWGTIDIDFMRRLAEENGGHFEQIMN